MADFLNLLMLICVSAGSLAFGILAAYGLLRAGFALMKPRERQLGLKDGTPSARIA
jgi:hypothetical protein